MGYEKWKTSKKTSKFFSLSIFLFEMHLNFPPEISRCSAAQPNEKGNGGRDGWKFPEFAFQLSMHIE
jgi:hypothetical protein